MNTIKKFVLMGIMLFSGYLGFAQMAVFRIISTGDLHNQNACLELEYRKVSDSSGMVNVVYITPAWESYGDEYYYSSYTLTGLECGEVYEVRVRAYISYGVYTPEYGLWSIIEIIMPLEGEDGYFDIECNPLSIRTLNVPEPEVVFSEERDTAKEAIKEE